jgi:putative amidase-like protein
MLAGTGGISRRSALFLIGAGAASTAVPIAIKGPAAAVTASEVLTTVRAYMASRAGSASPGAAPLGRAGMSAGVYAFEGERAAYLRSLGQRFDWDGVIKRMSSSITAVQVQVDEPKSCVVSLYETMRVDWAPNPRIADPAAAAEPADPNEPNDGSLTVSELGTPHQLRLSRGATGWTVIGDVYFERDLFGDSPGAAKVGPVVLDRLQAARSRKAQRARRQVAPQARRGARRDPAYDVYNRQDAATYAVNHALNYNPNYVDYNCSGGDCANFVSQSMYAGDQLPAGNWDRIKTSSCGTTNEWGGKGVQWYNNQSLRTWVINQGRGGSQSTVTGLHKGSIINYDWTGNGSTDHVTIMTNAASLFVCSHNNDRKNVPWQMGGAGAYRFTELSEHY